MRPRIVLAALLLVTNVLASPLLQIRQDGSGSGVSTGSGSDSAGDNPPSQGGSSSGGNSGENNDTPSTGGGNESGGQEGASGDGGSQTTSGKGSSTPSSDNPESGDGDTPSSTGGKQSDSAGGSTSDSPKNTDDSGKTGTGEGTSNDNGPSKNGTTGDTGTTGAGETGNGGAQNQTVTTGPGGATNATTPSTGDQGTSTNVTATGSVPMSPGWPGCEACSVNEKAYPLANGTLCPACYDFGGGIIDREGNWDTPDRFYCPNWDVEGHGSGDQPSLGPNGQPQVCAGFGGNPFAADCNSNCNLFFGIANTQNACSENVFSAGSRCQQCGLPVQNSGSGQGITSFLNDLSSWCAKTKCTDLKTGAHITGGPGACPAAAQQGGSANGQNGNNGAAAGGSATGSNGSSARSNAGNGGSSTTVVNGASGSSPASTVSVVAVAVTKADGSVYTTMSTMPMPTIGLASDSAGFAQQSTVSWSSTPVRTVTSSATGSFAFKGALLGWTVGLVAVFTGALLME